MRTKDILMRYPAMRDSVIAFVDMENDTTGKVLPRLESAAGSDVVYNGERVQLFLLNDRLRKDADFQHQVWRGIERACSLSHGARKLGLTLDQVILIHLLQTVELGIAKATGPETFIDTLNWWCTRAGRQTWRYTVLELSAMWENRRSANCLSSRCQCN